MPTPDNERKVIDVTIALRAGMAVWPGDTEFALTQAAWGSVTVGAASMSLHTGTHADAPSHFLPGGASIDAIDPAVYLGECLVLEVVGVESIGPEAFPGDLPPRVLLKTLAWTDHAVFPGRVPTLTESAVARLGALGVLLVGVDVPSVDAIDSKELPIHHSLAHAGIAIIESLDLRAAPPGRYTLIALPLPFVGGDASPVRAVLLPLDRSIDRSGS